MSSRWPPSERSTASASAAVSASAARVVARETASVVLGGEGPGLVADEQHAVAAFRGGGDGVRAAHLEEPRRGEARGGRLDLLVGQRLRRQPGAPVGPQRVEGASVGAFEIARDEDLAERVGAGGFDEPADEGAGRGVRQAGVLSEEADADEGLRGGEESEAIHGRGPAVGRQLIDRPVGGDGAALDEAGQRQEAAPSRGHVERPRTQVAQQHVGQFVLEHGVGEHAALDVELAPPRFRDGGAAGAHEGDLLGLVAEDQHGDAAAAVAQPGEATDLVDAELAVLEEEQVGRFGDLARRPDVAGISAREASEAGRDVGGVRAVSERRTVEVGDGGEPGREG